MHSVVNRIRYVLAISFSSWKFHYLSRDIFSFVYANESTYALVKNEDVHVINPSSFNKFFRFSFYLFLR